MTKKDAIKIIGKALSRSKTSSERVLVNKNALEMALTALKKSFADDVEFESEWGYKRWFY